MRKLLLTVAAIVFATAAQVGTRLYMHDIPASTNLVGSQPNGWQIVQNDPNACGMQILLPWSFVDKGPGTSPQYDWAALDSFIDTWAAKGKLVGITFTSVAANLIQQMGPLYYDTPSYVLNAGEPIIQCHQELGDPTAASPPTPDYLDSRYLGPWKAFIAAAIAKYQDDPRIAFFNIGIGANESFPEADESLDPNCVPKMNAMGINAQTWLAHALDMVDYVASLHPHIQVFWDLNDQGSLDINAKQHGFMTTVAAEAHKFGMGVGNDGFGDLAGKHTAYFTSGGPLATFAPLWYAETASVANQGGPSYFPSVLGEAVTLKIPTLHIYAQEWEIAYDPQNSNYPKYHAAYQTAFKSVAPVSGPACRIGAGQP